jgi:ABC-type branched-subunit amino acid transport system ATPase component
MLGIRRDGRHLPRGIREALGVGQEVQHLHKVYGDTVAVDAVSFTVQEDEVFGILSPNGVIQEPPFPALTKCATPTRQRTATSDQPLGS